MRRISRELLASHFKGWEFSNFIINSANSYFRVRIKKIPEVAAFQNHLADIFNLMENRIEEYAYEHAQMSIREYFLYEYFRSG